MHAEPLLGPYFLEVTSLLLKLRLSRSLASLATDHIDVLRGVRNENCATL